MQESKIYPMMLPLGTIRKKLYFVCFPPELKEDFIDLEGRSNKKFKKDANYKLPFETLHKMLVQYLNVYCNQVTTRYIEDEAKIEDRYWLVSNEPIDTGKLSRLVKIWLDAFYIQETELVRKRTQQASKEDSKGTGESEKAKKAKQEVKSFAKQLCDKINESSFQCEESPDEVELSRDGFPVSNFCFQVLPMMAVRTLNGRLIHLGDGDGTKFQLIKDSTQSLVTEPERIFDRYQKDCCSVRLFFSVQTLPPDGKAFLNVELSEVRWLSRGNEKNQNINHQKKAFLRIREDCLQSVQLSRQNKVLTLSWKDQQWLSSLWPDYQAPDFQNLLTAPKDYWLGTSKTTFPIYLPYDTQMSHFSHNKKAGASMADRKNIFAQISQVLLPEQSLPAVTACHVANTSHANVTSYFDKNTFELLEESDFPRAVLNALDGRKLTIEVWSNQADPEMCQIASELNHYLNKHFSTLTDTVRLVQKDLGTLGDYLTVGKELSKSQSNRNRIKEIIDEIPQVERNEKNQIEPHLCFVVIHSQEYFEQKNWEIYRSYLSDSSEEKTSGEKGPQAPMPATDPKTALRIGFAKTGRLTQFITLEHFKDYLEEKEKAKAKAEKMQKTVSELNDVIKSTILDGYRQLGILPDLRKINSLSKKSVVGVRVQNYLTDMKGQPYQPFPVFCTLENEQIRIYCDLFDSNPMYYDEFQRKFVVQMYDGCVQENGKNANPQKSILYVARSVKLFLENWFKQHPGILLVENNALSRRVFRNISNKSIKKEEQTAKYFSLALANGYEKTISCLLSNEKLLGIVRLRTTTNHEVPDYYTDQSTEKSFQSHGGIFQYEDVYYSLDVKALNDKPSYFIQNSVATSDSQFSHRRLIELYPFYVGSSDKIELLKCAHDLRTSAIQFQTQMTKLPLPMMLIDAALNDYNPCGR